ncbi:hypothetical protein COX08_03790 [Candidatus Beckwithbacteria bacterium CG23_combo_of_CG06-09_8_20_14_all_34_8]|uniref:LTD domain-containing protein n=1 Tax=Candidatus Beckwithbacteria bacterium CG23_combo_of_CG06-09_8_20_14_all_34_8 TaxID=1974497 RepID=A0A2H0B5N7_9BACT|nr:MAG: hypothetical protein COX08_03790 [Candidatus Beckwithbacteria bacterium CG23_combo_of_CG06-09_8_20_14_all_34_8]
MDLRYKFLLIISSLLILFNIKHFGYATNSISINNIPSQIKTNEEGNISFSAILSANTDYYVKVRGGFDSSDMTFVETKHPETEQWLGDRQNWKDMPMLTTIEDGTVNASLHFRFKSTATTGINKITVRFVKTDNKTSYLDSNINDIILLNADPTPTSAPTTVPSPTNTPKPTNTPTPIPTATNTNDYENIKLSEIYASPESGENEWIEIYNENDFSVDLNSWYFQDNAGTYKELKDFSIGGKSYAYFAFGSGYLNNIGDSITLLNSDKQRKDILPATYPSLSKDQSWAKVGDDWCITVPSKGEANTQCQNQTTATITPTNTPKPSTKASSTPKSSPKETSESQILNDDSNSRQLPVLGDQDTNIQASESGSTSKTSSKLLLPLGIAGSGLVLLGGSLTALTKPEIFASIIRMIINR